MIGQLKTISKLTSLKENFPNYVILLGEEGSGRHTLTHFISKNFLHNYPVEEITDKIDLDIINEMYVRSSPCIYLMDFSLIDERKQNMLLKILESDLDGKYFIIIAENQNQIISTILNRVSVKINMEKYSKEELSQFILTEENQLNKEAILKVCSTPGQILKLNYFSFSDVLDLCKKFVSKVSKAAFFNTLTIADKLNYKDEYNKFDFNIFLNALTLTMYEHFKETNDKNMLKLFDSTIELKEKLSYNKIVNKRILFENYLTNI